MRSVALFLVAFTLLATWPLAGATNECTESRCKAVDVPAPPPQAPSCSPVPPPGGVYPCVPARFYVDHGAASCSDNACKGVPPGKVVGLVWEETNAASGLQRRVYNGLAADTLLLV